MILHIIAALFLAVALTCAIAGVVENRRHRALAAACGVAACLIDIGFAAAEHQRWLAIVMAALGAMQGARLIGMLAGRSNRESRGAWQRNAILDALREHPDGMYGLDLCKTLKVGSGSLYPALDKLERAGLVAAFWDHDRGPDSSARRRYTLAAARTDKADA